MYTATITVPTQTKLEKVFQPEEKKIGERAHYTITQQHGQYVFHVEAKDVTALRACLNGITKVLSVNEKTIAIIEKNK